jgi:hypothetical protein
MHAACLTTYHVNILLEGELFRTLRASPEAQDELAAHAHVLDVLDYFEETWTGASK